MPRTPAVGQAAPGPALVAQHLLAQVQRLPVGPRVVGDRVDPAVGELGDQVAAADLQGVEPELAGGALHQPLHHHHVLRPGHPAVRRGRRLVRGDRAPAHPVGRHPVDAGHLRRGHQRLDARGERVAGVGAHVADDVGLQGEDLPVGGECGAGGVVLLAGQEARGQRLAPVLDPLHRTAEAPRGGRGGDLLPADDALLPEPAAHVRHDDPDLLLVEPGAAGQDRAHLVRDLGAGAHHQLLVAVVPVGDDAAGLQRQRVLPPGAGLHGDHRVRLVEDAVDALGGEQRHVDEHVAGGLVVHRGTGRGQRGGLGHHRVERVELDDGGLHPVLGGVGVGGDHDG